MSIVSQIITGTIKSILNQEDELYRQRISICRDCQLIKQDKIFGEICNPQLYMNTQGEVSKTPKLGFQHGCGCILRSKCRVKESQCPLNR
jgi:hypothetical protein